MRVRFVFLLDCLLVLSLLKYKDVGAFLNQKKKKEKKKGNPNRESHLNNSINNIYLH